MGPLKCQHNTVWTTKGAFLDSSYYTALHETRYRNLRESVNSKVTGAAAECMHGMRVRNAAYMLMGVGTARVMGHAFVFVPMFL